VRLKNDYKDLMSRIEAGLHAHHARLAQEARDASSAAPASTSTSTSASATVDAPFAKVNTVAPGSPADSAGLKVGDLVIKFGWVDWTNHDGLSRVAEAVSQNEGVSCPIPFCLLPSGRLNYSAISQPQRLVLTWP
jgi:26S proteasome non-ATPase regulatory subunit 9